MFGVEQDDPQFFLLQRRHLDASKLAISSGEPTCGRSSGESAASASQLQRGFQAHGLGIAHPTYPRQLDQVHAKEPTQPAMVRQQPLREVGYGLPHAADIQNM